MAKKSSLTLQMDEGKRKLHDIYDKHVPNGDWLKCSGWGEFWVTTCSCGRWYYKASNGEIDPMYGDIAADVLAKYPYTYESLKAYYKSIHGTKVLEPSTGDSHTPTDWSFIRAQAIKVRTKAGKKIPAYWGKQCPKATKERSKCTTSTKSTS